MAYTIVKSDGTVLTTITDGTINTTSTSQGLPGRNYAGYGQSLDTNIVHQIENFAYTAPPANPLRGQLWYNTSANTLNVCPADGTTNPASWLTLAQSGSSGTTTFGAVTVTGNLAANNISSNYFCNAATGVFTDLTVSGLATITNANITTANIGTANTRIITTGAAATTGAMTGTWTVTGAGTNAFVVVGGNLSTPGIRTDNYRYANGDPISFAGSYGNANVAVYLPTFEGSVGNVNSNVSFRGNVLTTGASGNAGVITGNWTLSGGSRLNATYADLAERFESDAEYDAGTVVEIGGSKEITSVVDDLSDNVFGVVSHTAAYLMNSAAGSDSTHPAIAMSGRVQVKVDGKIKKGDRLVSAGSGRARAAVVGEATAFNTIGRSLANKTDAGAGTVEAIVTIKG